MLRAALIGIGAMGRGHLDNYIRLINENDPDIKLVAVCDVDKKKFENVKLDFNLDVGKGDYDFSAFNCYTDANEMLEKESLDLVTIALPTYLHCEYTVKCLDKGINVLCEKPMALNEEQCQAMIDAALRNGKKLMIGHCLRFWGEYEVLKNITDSGEYGAPVAAYFFRGGGTPLWSFENWLCRRECGGGALLDQHVHDVDTINYLFGLPDAVSTIGKIVIEGSGYDTLTTNYFYSDSKAVNAQDDWVMSGGGFSMLFRVNFERGTVVMNEKGFFVAAAGEKFHTPEYCKENAYYKELKYFARCIIDNTPVSVNPPEDSMSTIKIVQAEISSADNLGKITYLKY